MVVVLEEVDGSSAHSASTALLHGGAGSNGSSRWYDKHQIIAFPDGTLGVSV
jgi:hypothetical protein